MEKKQKIGFEIKVFLRQKDNENGFGQQYDYALFFRESENNWNGKPNLCTHCFVILATEYVFVFELAP